MAKNAVQLITHPNRKSQSSFLAGIGATGAGNTKLFCARVVWMDAGALPSHSAMVSTNWVYSCELGRWPLSTYGKSAPSTCDAERQRQPIAVGETQPTSTSKSSASSTKGALESSCAIASSALPTTRNTARLAI